MCSRCICVVRGTVGGDCAAGGFLLFVVQFGGVSVHQVLLCCGFGTVGGVSVHQVDFNCVWDSWGSECASGGFVVGVCVWVWL